MTAGANDPSTARRRQKSKDKSPISATKAVGEEESSSKGDKSNDDGSAHAKNMNRSAKSAHRSHTHSHHSSRRGDGTKRFLSGRKMIFILGTLLGLFGAHYLANHNATIEMVGASQEWLLAHKDSLPQTLVDMIQLSQVSTKNQTLSDDFVVGMMMYDDGMRAKHPVIMVPGVISSALEDWGLHGTEECPSKPHYRKQLWGGFYMIKSMLLSTHCWLQHLLLDKETGLDPPHFKIRAAQGIESADYFITGYWIWNKIVQNLAAIGYDSSTMKLAAYDWRLGYPDLERRDGYFTMLKSQCEQNLLLTGEKTSLVGHSMGSQVVFYFLKWVEAEGPGFGNGGKDWVNKHVAHFVDISGSMLGTPKALVSLLSGEMKDTVSLNQFAVMALEKFFSRDARTEMLRTWPGIASMLPKGGDTIWGDMNGAPDDPKNASDTFGNFIRFTEHMSPLSARNLTLDESIDFLFDQSPDWFVNRVRNMYSFGLAKTRKEVERNERDPSKWSNPLEVALPYAPDLRVFALYGVGKDTERAYFYRDSSNDTTTPLNAVIDYEKLEHSSVVVGPGDGTISLPCHSMAYRWRDKNSKFNPAHCNVTVVEMEHKPTEYDLRGGAQTAEHVDILGRAELNELVLRIVSGHGADIKNHVHSNIEDWVYDLDLGAN